MTGATGPTVLDLMQAAELIYKEAGYRLRDAKHLGHNTRIERLILFREQLRDEWGVYDHELQY